MHANRVRHAIDTEKHLVTIDLPEISVMLVALIERHDMSEAAISPPTCFIHQILPRSFHDLVAKLRQETARADVLGETGNPVIVIGIRFALDRHDGAFSARLGLGCLVEGQDRAVWSPSDLHRYVRGTPAEAVLAQMLRVATDGSLPVSSWVPPDALGLTGCNRLVLAALGSLAVISHIDGAGGDADAAGWPWIACLQQGRSEIESLELPLRAASDFRRFRAVQAGSATVAPDPDFSGIEAVLA